MFWVGALVGLFIGVFLGLFFGGLLTAASRGDDLLAAALALEEKPGPSSLTNELQKL
jgi:hypothetical protein